MQEPPTVLKILFQRGSYDSTTLVATKNEDKVAIPSECLDPMFGRWIDHVKILDHSTSCSGTCSAKRLQF